MFFLLFYYLLLLYYSISNIKNYNEASTKYFPCPARIFENFNALTNFYKKYFENFSPR